MPNKFKSDARVIPIREAVGHVLVHDITEIRPGLFKGVAFRKGHVVREEDLNHLRQLGKEHLFVLDLGPGEVHENDAARRLAKALSGTGVIFEEKPAEGKISLKASHRGLLKVRAEALNRFNMVTDVTCASRHDNTLVHAGDVVAATRAIPLVIDSVHLDKAVQIAEESNGIFSVKPLSTPDTGLIITGNEVFYGRIEDKFAPIIRKKMGDLECPLKDTLFVPDEPEKITEAIRKLLDKGRRLVLVAGGMSVDPDDVSRMAIAEAGATDLVYGTPVLPGAMFLFGRIDDVPVLGLPACILYFRATVFDLILPRVLAGETITRADLAAMAHGGLCLGCEQCRFPVCPFGK